MLSKVSSCFRLPHSITRNSAYTSSHTNPLSRQFRQHVTTFLPVGKRVPHNAKALAQLCQSVGTVVTIA